jgi:hypothetical protein
MHCPSEAASQFGVERLGGLPLSDSARGEMPTYKMHGPGVLVFDTDGAADS